MASTSKQKTTMAKRDRENRLRERRALKKAKKDARKLAAENPEAFAETAPDDDVLAPAGEADDSVEAAVEAAPGDELAPAVETPPRENGASAPSDPVPGEDSGVAAAEPHRSAS